MSALYVADVTLEINGRESEFEVRGCVDLEMSYRGMTAVIDGPVQVRRLGRWMHLDEVRGLSAESRERALSALEEEALTDDSDDRAAEERGDMDREEACV